MDDDRSHYLADLFYRRDKDHAEWCRMMAQKFPASDEFYMRQARIAEQRVSEHERIYGKEAA